jgi:hypothetical protein
MKGNCALAQIHAMAVFLRAVDEFRGGGDVEMAGKGRDGEGMDQRSENR